MYRFALFSICILFFALGAVHAATSSNCALEASLVNQDPVHAVPGEYVKVVFQLRGLQNPGCSNVLFRVVPDYPFSLDPGVDPTKMFVAGTYSQDYGSQVTIPYTLRVDVEALDEEYELEVEYGSALSGAVLFNKKFNITVEDVKTDFDLFVQDYNPTTHIATFTILNTGDQDVDALTVEVAPGQSVSVKGSTKSVIGSLDGGQDTTFTLELPSESATIAFSIVYTDQDGNRRMTSKETSFDPSYFTGRQRDQTTSSPWGWIIGLIIVVLIIVFFWRRARKKKKAQHAHRA